MQATMNRMKLAVVFGVVVALTGCDFGEGAQSAAVPSTQAPQVSVLTVGTPVVQSINVPACLLQDGGCDEPNKPTSHTVVETVGELCPTLGIDNQGANESLLAHANETQLTVVYTHGDVVKVALPVLETASGAKVWTKVHAQGDYILVERDWRANISGLRGLSLSMMDRDGNLAWHVHEMGVSGTVQALANASAVVNARTYPQHSEAFNTLMYIDPSGSVNQFEEPFRTLGAAVVVNGETSHVEAPVRLGDGHERQVGWLNLDDGTFNPFWHGQDANDVQLLGNHLFRFTPSCGYFLAVDTAGSTPDFKSLDFSFEAFDTMFNSRIVQTTQTGWVLFQHNETDEYTRLRLGSNGTNLSIAVQPQVLDLSAPEGFDLTCQIQPEMDDRGGMLFTFRNDVQAVVFRMDRQSDEWKAIGAPMAHIIPARLSSHGASLVVNTSLTKCEGSCGGLFEETTDGTTPISGPSVQVIHPRSGNTFVLDAVGVGSDPTNALPQFDTTGQCFSTSKWNKGTYVLEVVDVVIGTTTQVNIPGVPTWLN